MGRVKSKILKNVMYLFIKQSYNYLNASCLQLKTNPNQHLHLNCGPSLILFSTDVATSSVNCCDVDISPGLLNLRLFYIT